MNSDSNNCVTRSSTSKIPTPISNFKRSASLRIRGEKANISTSLPISSVIDEDGDYNGQGLWRKNLFPLNFNRSKFGGSYRNNIDDDLESICSVTSNFSTATTNSACEHVNFANNGTTYSGRSHKYIVHCSSGLNGEEEYLTPTQRANRNIKRLKSLLQLAKDKLREKEEEIFKLSKEVVELKTFKASVQHSNIPTQNSVDITDSSEEKVSSPESMSQSVINLATTPYCEISPIKHLTEENRNFLAPTISQDCLGEKTITTPDFMLSSLADSGNFDDMPSSASIYSKDSLSLNTTPELRNAQEEQSTGFSDFSGGSEEEEKIKIIKMYEKKLGDKKLEYEMELNRVITEQEENNLSIVNNFERRIKEEEIKFVARWNELLKASEKEKMMIVNRFEQKLAEERKKYKESLKNFYMQDGKVTDMVFEMTYSQKVNEEKTIYETSLMDIKQKFANEKSVIKEEFYDAIKAERSKFEESLKTIKELNDSKLQLTSKITELERKYSELLPKFEEAKLKTEELMKENETLKAAMVQQEESHKKIYMNLYKKSQPETSTVVVETQEGDKSIKKVSAPELFAQLKITEVELENLKDKEYRATHTDSQGLCLLSFKEAISLWMLATRKAMYKRLADSQAKSAIKEKSESDPEATLQFLKSAIYYFLTDRENHLDHLKAIESILGFSSTEKSNIEKLYLNRY